MKEQWRPIKGYEGLYEVSNMGRVKSVEFRNNITTKKRELIMRPTDNGHGYACIILRKDGKRSMKYIHRMVAEAFVPRPSGKNCVNHIDYNKQNNNANNLEWCTQRENVRWSRKNMIQRRKPGKSGYRNITLRKNGRLCVNASVNGKKIVKEVGTIEQALKVRDEFYEEYGYEKRAD